MLKGTVLERFWNGFDNLLLLAVMVLLAFWFYSSGQAERNLLKTSPTGALQNADEAVPVQSRPLKNRAVEGLRVSLDGSRMSNIARTMADPAWEQVPACPAMDMRDNGKEFEVFFALPAGVDGSRVRVDAQCGILTLTMASEETGAVLLQRFRIPCGITHEENIRTDVTNNVLRIRIHP